MKVLVVLSAFVAVSMAGIAPIAYNGLGYNGWGGAWGGWGGWANGLGYSGLGLHGGLGLGYAAAPLAVAAPAAVKSMYHSQDELGQASFGHAQIDQAHNAVRDAFGNVAGSFSYVDPHGKVVKTDYIADGAGYRVASNALPIAPEVALVGPAPVLDTPEVVAARAAHFAEVAAVKSRAKRQIIAGPLGYAGDLGLGLGLGHLGAPLAVPATRAGLLTTIVNTPGHAVSYRVD